MERDVALSGIDELWNERQKECRGLRIQGFDDHALSERAAGSGTRDVGREFDPRLPDGLDPEPQKINRADELEQRKRLRTRQNKGGHTTSTGDDMNTPTDTGADARCQPFTAATMAAAGMPVLARRSS